MTAHALLQRFGIENPILLAPMAGSGGTPELAAAVSNAGGLGAWGGAYAKPDDLAAAIRKIRQLTARPFNINLFAGGYATDHRMDPQPMLEIVAQVHAELGLPAPSLPPLAENPFAAQLEVVLEERPPVFSFTFGIPSAAQMAALKQRDIIVIGTATTAAEGRVLAQLGVDGIVAQGAEAGAHRGTFAASFEDSMVPMARLMRDICADITVPVIASGGIMDARDVAGCLKAGAAAVQLGTAFLPCPGIGRAGGSQAGAARRQKGYHGDHACLLRAAGARPEQPVHRDGGGQGGSDPAVPATKRPHAPDAQRCRP